jgi:hypothetical protein
VQIAASRSACGAPWEGKTRAVGRFGDLQPAVPARVCADQAELIALHSQSK